MTDTPLRGLDRVDAVNQSILSTGGVAPSAQVPNPHDNIGYNPTNDPTSSAYSINSSTLAPVTPITLPDPTLDTTSSGVAGKSQAIIDQNALTTKLEQDQADKQSKLDAQNSLLQTATGDISTLQSNRATAEGDVNTPGTPLYLKEVARKASNALDASQRAQQNEITAVQGHAELGQAGQNAAIQNINDKYGHEQADLQLSYHLANSDYTAAEDTLNSKFQLDLAPLQTKLSQQQSVYNDIKDSLNKAEDRTWTQTIADTKNEVDTETQNKKDISTIYQKLLETNPDALKNDPQLGVKLANAKDGQDALQILANNNVGLINPLDEAQKLATLAKTRQDIVNSGTVTGTDAKDAIGSDANDVLEGRNTLFNIRQTMGRSNQAAAYMQNLRSQIRAADPNFDFIASDAGGKSVSSTYVQKATASINSVLPNIDKVLDLSNQVPRVGITGVDALLQKGGTVINDQKISNFKEAQKLISDEIGVALGAGTVSDMKLQLGFDITDPSVSQEVFASNMELVKEFLQNRLSGLQSLRYKSATTGGTDTSATSTSPVDLSTFDFKLN